MIVRPIVIGIVFDGVVQEPDSAVRSAGQVLHGAVFQERRLEGALAKLAAIEVGRAGGAAPDLPDVAVATVEPRQARLRADDAPVSVVEEAVRRDVTADVAGGTPIEILNVIEDLLQHAAIEEVLELRRPPLGIH